MIKMPLPQPTDSLAEDLGIPDHCGERAYRFVYYNKLDEVVPWMVIDTVAVEYWMDVTIDYEKLGNALYDRDPLIVLEITLKDWPTVTPVFKLLQIDILCPDFHSSLQVLQAKPTTVNYDVTDAVLQEYVLHNIEIYPIDCFGSSDVHIFDEDGVTPSFARFNRGTSVSKGYANANKLQIDMGGVKAWDLLTTPITLYWSVMVEDGIYE